MQTNIISGADHIFEWVNLIAPSADEQSILVALLEGLFISSVLLFFINSPKSMVFIMPSFAQWLWLLFVSVVPIPS